MKTRQVQRVTAVRLHPVARLARNQARRHHHAVVARRHKLPVHPVAAGTGLINEAQHFAMRTQLANQATQRRTLVGDLAPVHRLLPTRRRNRHRDRLLVDVQTNV